MQTANKGKLRQRFFAISTFFCGVITFTLAIEAESLAIVNFTHIVCVIGWFLLAALFQFTTIDKKRIELFAFINMSLQILLTELVNFVVIEPLIDTYFSSAITILFLLNIIFLSTFLLFPKRQASVLSITYSAFSGLAILAAALRLPDGMALSQLNELTPVIVFLAICFFLTRALSSFRLEATSAKSQAKQFEKLAYFDELTGIANRRKLVNLLQKEISKSKRYNSELSIIIFDIDHFKAVNDTYGHNVGDQVLKAIATSVVNTIRTSDTLGRWGGEEFLCILPNTTANVAFELAERLRTGIADSLIDGGPDITASFGIAQLMQIDNFDSLVLRADQALYSAKDQGRNRCKPNPLKDTSEFYSFQIPDSKVIN